MSGPLHIENLRSRASVRVRKHLLGKLRVSEVTHRDKGKSPWVLLAGILCKNCKPLRKNILAATWCQCPDLAGSTPAPIQKKREPALTGQLSFCYDDKIGTRYKRGQKIRDHHRSDRLHESSLPYVRLTRPSFASAKLAQGKITCRQDKKKKLHSMFYSGATAFGLRSTLDRVAPMEVFLYPNPLPESPARFLAGVGYNGWKGATGCLTRKLR